MKGVCAAGGARAEIPGARSMFKDRKEGVTHSVIRSLETSEDAKSDGKWTLNHINLFQDKSRNTERSNPGGPGVFPWSAP